jgi:hypothetical protein
MIIILAVLVAGVFIIKAKVTHIQKSIHSKVDPIAQFVEKSGEAVVNTGKKVARTAKKVVRK